MIERFVNEINQTENDLYFWKTQLEKRVESLVGKNPDGRAFQSSFTVYDMQLEGGDSKLFAFEQGKEDWMIADLEDRKEMFFRWIHCLALMRLYNTMEVLITDAIIAQYCPEINEIKSRKKKAESLKQKVRQILDKESIKFDSKDNGHLITFLETRNSRVKKFLDQPSLSGVKDSWRSFFLLASKLRHLVAHNAMQIDLAGVNTLKSSSKELYEKYFSANGIEENELNYLAPKEQSFLHFLKLYNIFGLNMVKFIQGNDSFDYDSRFKSVI